MTNYEVFKLGVGNHLGIYYKCYGFGVERSKVKVRVMDRVNVGSSLVTKTRCLLCDDWLCIACSRREVHVSFRCLFHCATD